MSRLRSVTGVRVLPNSRLHIFAAESRENSGESRRFTSRRWMFSKDIIGTRPPSLLILILLAPISFRWVSRQAPRITRSYPCARARDSLQASASESSRDSPRR